jgi:hypothetical protein
MHTLPHQTAQEYPGTPPQVSAFLCIEIQEYFQTWMCMHVHSVFSFVWFLFRCEYDYISCSSIVAGRALRECRIEQFQGDQCEVAFW